jgi:hypothetical protein
LTHRYGGPGHIPQPRRFTRFAPVSLFQVGESGDVVATEAAGGEPATAAPLVRRLRRVALGPPLITSAVVDERMRKLTAMGVLSGDLLSSVAYGPQAMVTVLALAGAGALSDDTGVLIAAGRPGGLLAVCLDQALVLVGVARLGQVPRGEMVAQLGLGQALVALAALSWACLACSRTALRT